MKNKLWYICTVLSTQKQHQLYKIAQRGKEKSHKHNEKQNEIKINERKRKNIQINDKEAQ